MKDVIFKSEYAPTVIANLTKEQIKASAEDAKVEFIGLYEEPEAAPCTFETSKQTIRVDKVFSQIGLKGTNVKVGMFENGVPLDHEELDPDRITAVGTNVAAQDHPRWVAICLAGSTLGIAPEALVYATNANLSNIEALISQGIVVMNVSWGYIRSGAGTYTYEDKWFDHIAKEHNLLLMCSAGNEEDDGRSCVRSPAMAYNTLAVGAFEDKSTGNNLADDQLYVGSSYNHTGSLKPDLVAPMNTTNGATSFAAPVVTGIAALLLELKPALCYQPQTLKAILMASCQRKVLSHAGTADETMEQGLTRKQGAGAVDAWNAVCIVAQGNYGYGEVTSATEKRSFVQPSYGASNMNVTIAWLRDNTISSSNHSSGTVSVGTQQDLDLSVYRNGKQVGSSFNSNSSTEMAYFPLSAGESRYQIRVSKEDLTNTETVSYGYAWSTDNMSYRENLTGTNYPDGIYYIRSKSNANGAYLTVDEETGQISQKAFTGAENQQWISSKTGYNPFTIQTNSSAYPGYLSISGQTNAWIRQDSEQYITFGGNNLDNTYGIQLYGLPSSNSRSLTALDTGAPNSTAIWRNIGIPERFQWYFEPVGYIRGDVNRDGTVSNADVLLTQNYVSKVVNLDAAQKFLADMNNDGQINVSDVQLIQEAVSAG